MIWTLGKYQVFEKVKALGNASHPSVHEIRVLQSEVKNCANEEPVHSWMDVASSLYALCQTIGITYATLSH